jgi:hypothetical protein
MANSGQQTVIKRYSCYLDFSLLTISDESMRNRMSEAGSSALNLVDEQVQQNIRVFETILLNLIPSQPQGSSSSLGCRSEPSCTRPRRAHSSTNPTEIRLRKSSASQAFATLWAGNTAPRTDTTGLIPWRRFLWHEVCKNMVVSYVKRHY